MPSHDTNVRLRHMLDAARRRLPKGDVKGLSQVDLAAKLQSSQSRVAKMEAGDPSVSLDLLIRSLITPGASHHELSRIIATRRAA